MVRLRPISLVSWHSTRKMLHFLVKYSFVPNQAPGLLLCQRRTRRSFRALLSCWYRMSVLHQRKSLTQAAFLLIQRIGTKDLTSCLHTKVPRCGSREGLQVSLSRYSKTGLNVHNIPLWMCVRSNAPDSSNPINQSCIPPKSRN